MTDDHSTYAGCAVEFPPGKLRKLENRDLVYNMPEPAIRCTKCGFALKADSDRVSRREA